MRVYMKRYLIEHPEFYANAKRRGAARRLEMKIQVLTHYGHDGALECCWSSCTVRDVDMLTIDHINDDGADHREQLTGGKYRTGGGLNFYGWLIRNNFPDGFQTLCYNHQWKKEILRRKMKMLLNG